MNPSRAKSERADGGRGCTWVVGDVQGCWRTLEALVARLRLADDDRVVLAGDLVNRGPDSLSVLRWAARDPRVDAVLGNHDLHLLATAAGLRTPGRRDTLDAVLAAPDRDRLLNWLRARPLARRLHGHLVVHAGLDPRWTIDAALAHAADAAAHVRAGDQPTLLRRPDEPRRWEPDEEPVRRRQLALAVLTTARLLAPDHTLLDDAESTPEDAPSGALPWFLAPGRAWVGEATVVFGHWAALGHRVGDGFVALDSGCVWGGALTAVRLEDRAIEQHPSLDA